ncbi:MAG: putative DNA-binding domain-containing protein [Burkholderiales bacterium]|nr:putative DNA-binding domain-containing protein [Burkholderiales bacterium]MDE2276485.1 putative DNA-binding domain-containing protein [Burkholderiales bacterium]
MPRDPSAQGAFADALLDPARPGPRGLRAWNGSDPTVRLGVHRNNVVSSLIDALADTFPVTQELVGVEFFRAMAARFVRQAPPRSRILAHYGGGGFAGFIEGFEPARPLPYLADMARLEFARVRAYHAADAEPVAAEVVGRALGCDERIGELRLVGAPSLAAVDSGHPVVSLWAAHQGDGDLAAIDVDQPEAALVLRPALDVLVLKCPAGAATFVVALQDGLALGDAAERAAARAPAFDLAASLSLLLAHGALAAIHLPRSLAR